MIKKLKQLIGQHTLHKQAIDIMAGLGLELKKEHVALVVELLELQSK